MGRPANTRGSRSPRSAQSCPLACEDNGAHKARKENPAILALRGLAVLLVRPVPLVLLARRVIQGTTAQPEQQVRRVPLVLKDPQGQREIPVTLVLPGPQARKGRKVPRARRGTRET